jgi:hypothetical protein
MRFEPTAKTIGNAHTGNATKTLDRPPGKAKKQATAFKSFFLCE